MCCIPAFIGESILFGCFGETDFFFGSRNAVIDIQLALRSYTIYVAGTTNINIEPAIVIDIYHYNSGTPILLVNKSRLLRNIFKLPITFVFIKLVGAHIGRKKNICESIIIDITNGYASAVIKIAVGKNIEVFCICYIIGKVNAGRFF